MTPRLSRLSTAGSKGTTPVDLPLSSSSVTRLEQLQLFPNGLVVGVELVGRHEVLLAFVNHASVSPATAAQITKRQHNDKAQEPKIVLHKHAFSTTKTVLPSTVPYRSLKT